MNCSSINDKNLNSEIETAGIIFPELLKILTINDKNLNSEIETWEQVLLSHGDTSLSTIRISILRLKRVIVLSQWTSIVSTINDKNLNSEIETIQKAK